MKKSRFTESQNVAVLKEGEAGVPVTESAPTTSPWIVYPQRGRPPFELNTEASPLSGSGRCWGLTHWARRARRHPSPIRRLETPPAAPERRNRLILQIALARRDSGPRR